MCVEEKCKSGCKEGGCKIYDESEDWGDCKKPADGGGGGNTSTAGNNGTNGTGMDGFGYSKGQPCVMIKLNRVNNFFSALTLICIKCLTINCVVSSFIGSHLRRKSRNIMKMIKRMNIYIKIPIKDISIGSKISKMIYKINTKSMLL